MFQKDCDLIKSIASDFHACNDEFKNVSERPSQLDFNLGILDNLKNRNNGGSYAI
jgi:hypothetical protein